MTEVWTDRSMTQFEQLRARMVDNQLRTSGITDWDLLRQMSQVPRERFVPEDRQSLAYIDDIHWLGEGTARRFMMAPATLGKLLQLAELDAKDAVLDVGANTGYGAAVIAGLADSVVALEANAALAEMATRNLQDLGIANARVVAGDMAAVGAEKFDVIIVEGALNAAPDAMLNALKDGGRLVALIRERGVSVANVFVKSGSAITARSEFNATLPSLDQAQPAVEFVF